MGEGGQLSEWGMRRAAERRGYPVTHAQFESYRQWQLLPEPVRGRWPAEHLERLVLIRQLGQTVRSLPRRTLRLRADYDRFPLPADTVQRAMAEVALGIESPRRKARRMAQALAQAGLIAEDALSAVQTQPRTPPIELQWKRLLEGTEARFFEERLPFIYYWLKLLRVLYPDAAKVAEPVPFEEQVVLFSILDIEATRRMQPRTSTLQ